ncbi:MAG: DUF1570 domain-containing protein [Pirellulales bacterium]|nr:DUF1570 domain-containing protein [Pirellulales bacterium]
MHKLNNIKITAIATCLAACLLLCDSAVALDHVTFVRDGKRRRVDGRLVVEAKDGGLMLTARDGVIWTIPPEELIEHSTDDTPFKPLSRDELSMQILAELPEGFDVYGTTNYLVFYDTSKGYARWCAALFERLYRAFSTHWKGEGFKLPEPEFPLVAIVFSDKDSYERFARAELGDAVSSIIGYFSLRTNRMVMYDLTGIGRAKGRGSSSLTAITKVLSRPQSAATMATIVHEATHQIAYNRGLHERYSDCPLWFSEGIAMYFEMPDLQSKSTWRGIGKVNTPRLIRFGKYARNRPGDSLATLLTNDDRFRDTSTSLDAYAEAWALTYFLIKQRGAEYVKYLRLLSQKKPLIWDTPEVRRKQFEEIFGDLDELNVEFLRYMGKIR